MKINKDKLFVFYRQKDKFWLLIWISATLLVGFWDLLFLNMPAMRRVFEAFINTFFISFTVVFFTLGAGWLAAILLHSMEIKQQRAAYIAATFMLNLIRSIPQIVGVLFYYVGITILIQKGVISEMALIFVLMASGLCVFIFLEVADLMRERIDHYKKLDFYNAMRVCGISERRIINYDILWKNSRIHILNKLISVFGMAIFLQCSIDFIISVGLSSDINAVTLPPTLGSLLAKIDSKQDILAVGHTITHPTYFPNLFFDHLQGVTVAFLIVFSLLCIYRISNGFAERHRL